MNNNNKLSKNFIVKNEGFTCENCGQNVLPLSNGSCRNHCPECFYSKHLDNLPGDRESECKSLMLPIDYDYNSKKGYVIIHKCIKCGKTIKNKMAFYDETQPDNYEKFIKFIEKLNYRIK